MAVGRGLCRMPINGLPIGGGPSATDNAVIPYSGGVDTACRMKLSVFDRAVRELDRRRTVCDPGHRRGDAL